MTGSVTYSYEFRRELKLGSRGPDVIELQTALQDLGYLRTPPAEAKGLFGTATREALIRFQREKKVTPDGVLSQATRSLLSLRQLQRPSTEIDFSTICLLPARVSYLGLFGHTEIQFAGVVGGLCRLQFGMESENPDWDRKLDHVCRVPLRKFIFGLNDQIGIDLTAISRYCSVTE